MGNSVTQISDEQVKNSGTTNAMTHVPSLDESIKLEADEIPATENSLDVSQLSKESIN